MNVSSKRGQSLIELTVGIAIGVLFITAAIGAILVSLRLDFQNRYTQTASQLATEIIEQVTAVASNDWHDLDLEIHDPLVPYHIDASGSTYAVADASSTVTFESVEYTTSFTIEDVRRDNTDAFVEAPLGTIDPSTLKITATVSWTQQNETTEFKLVQYVTRSRNRIWLQTDWSGGYNFSGPVATTTTRYFTSVNMATSSAAGGADGELSIDDLSANQKTIEGNGIDGTYRYVWNDLIGWVDFLYYGNVTVNSTMTGYASSGIQQIALDCATSPNGNICSSNGGYDFGVSKSTSDLSDGTFYGYAWNDAIGWISFNCDQTQGPNNPGLKNCANDGGADYAVTLVSGAFHGWAWNDVIGWLSFNCVESGTCPPGGSDYRLQTGASTISEAQLTSTTFDSQRAQGAAWNTVQWLGERNGGRVLFQLAGSDNLGGPWADSDFKGPDGTSSTYYEPLGQGIQARLSRADLNNKRYIRYRIYLWSNGGMSASPVVTDVIINWSL